MEYCQCPCLSETQKSPALLIYRPSLRSCVESGPWLKAWWIWAHQPDTAGLTGRRRPFLHECYPTQWLYFDFLFTARLPVKIGWLQQHKWLLSSNLWFPLWCLIQQFNNYYMWYICLVLVISQNKKDLILLHDTD